MSQQQQQHSQVFGSSNIYNNPEIIHPQQFEQGSVVLQDVNHHFDLQRQQISNSSMHMDLARWQQYYSQISAGPHEMSSFIGDVKSIGKINVCEPQKIQPSSKVIRTMSSLGGEMFQSSHHPHQQMLFTQQATSNNNSNMSDLASFSAHQQYLLLAQQQQQYLEQKKQQQQIIHHASNPSIASTSFTPYIQQKSSQCQQNIFPLKSYSQNTTVASFEHREKPQIIQKIKSPENPRILAQRELELQVKRKEQEDAKQSQLVKDDLNKRQLNAKERIQGLQERLQSIPDPIHLAGCHTLSKVSNFIPFPSEIISSTTLSCFEQQQAKMVLSNRDPLLADYLGTLLSDSTDNLRRIEMKKTEDEITDQLTGISPIPPLIEAIQSISQFAFSVESEPFENIEENEQDQINKEQYFQKDEHQIDEKQNNQLMASSTNEQLNKPEIEETIIKQIIEIIEPSNDSLNDYSTAKCNKQIDTVINENNEDQLSNSASEDHENDGNNDTKNSRSRKRRRSSNENNDETKTKIILARPPTPTEVIKQRELDWNERQKQREEKYKKRKQLLHNNQQIESWNIDIVAENESFLRFTALIDQILEQIDEEMSTTSTMCIDSGEEFGFSIEKSILEELRIEAQKLKAWQKLSDVPTEKLVKLLAVLEKNINEVLIDNEDGTCSTLYARIRGNENDETEDTFRELIDERLLKSVDAALTSLCIMTSRRMPKQVLVEDVFERSVQLCKQCLHHVIYPNTDYSLKSQSSKLRKSLDSSFIKKNIGSRNVNTSQLYSRLLDLLTCFSELARLHSLNETLMIQLGSLCTPPFFVENVPEVQMQAIKLLPIIFAKCPTLRRTLLLDLLNMVHKLPLTRSIRNSYRLSSHESIGNFTVLILQLVQSAVQLPPRKAIQHQNDYRHEKIRDSDDKIVLDSFDEAKKLAAFFLGGFLGKCTAKAEDDYRRLFEQFLQDILVALYRPMWPVAEMVLTVLGNLLIMHYRSKTFDLSLRVASLDYLGIITARLRKDRVTVLSADSPTQEKTRLNSIVKSILFDENSYDPNYNVEEVDISHLSSSEKIRKLEQALFDYIIGTMWDGDVSVEYILLFYAVEWYRETVLDVEVVKERYVKAIGKSDLSHKEGQKNEQKIARISEKGQSMKLFIMGLMDKQHLKRRMQFIAKNGNVLVECDANWVVKYLASKKELSHLFDVYLRRILEGFKPDLYPVAIRAKAMKCLAQIVEADSQVLMIPEVNKIVQDRLIDSNASVREATFDLIGKCLVSKPDLFDTYYSILINRTKDTAIAVRKRVVRILRDVVLLRPKHENAPQILSEIIQRINDEESVKKMCLETFQQLWMSPVHAKLNEKVRLLVETTIFSIMEGSADHIGTLINVLVKNSQEQNVIVASRQLVDALVDYVLNLEKEAVQDQKLDEVNLVRSKDFQTRLFATLTILFFFAKARAELLIRHIEVFMPYLSISSSSTLESRVLNQIIGMLEEIIPLMDSYNTSQILIRQLDARLNNIVKDGGMLLIASAISCMSEIQLKFLQTEEQPSICRLFIVYYKYLEKSKIELERSNDSSTPFELSPEKKPNLLRALYSIGLMCRYFDFDILLKNDQRDLFIDDSVSVGFCENIERKCVVRDSVFLILFYYSRFSDHTISQKALIALGQLAAGCPEILRREELKSLYMVLLNSDKQVYLQLKVQVLKNITCFLYAEEQRAMKRAAQTKLDREQQSKQQEDDSLVIDDILDEQQQRSKLDNLKEMESGSSGLSSSIIQQYWNAILKCYFHNDETVRVNSSQVIRQTLEQGLVTPGSSVPTLIAMSTDILSGIRTRVEILIREMNSKYKGLILSKAVAGIRLSFQLQKKIRSKPSKIIRGFRANDNPLNSNRSFADDEKLPTHSSDVTALLSIFYINVRANRQNRRAFLSSLLKIFSEENNEKTEQEEWLYLADNLAHFPYSVMDEPLYVIHQANTIISVSGQNILSQLRQLLIHAQLGSRLELNKDETNVNNSINVDELEEFSVEYIKKHLPEDKERIYELKKNSHACFILLHLKKFLMHIFGFKEDKIAEYSPSEPTNVHEKPVNRRNIPVFSPDFIFNEIEKNKIVDDDIKIAEDFHRFHEMLLSLDDKKDDDEISTLAVYTSVDEESSYF